MNKTEAMKKCKHEYLYEFTIYGDDKNISLKIIHRQCRFCGVHQLAKTKAWHKPHRRYNELPDLRDE